MDYGDFGRVYSDDDSDDDDYEDKGWDVYVRFKVRVWHEASLWESEDGQHGYWIEDSSSDSYDNPIIKLSLRGVRNWNLGRRSPGEHTTTLDIGDTDIRKCMWGIKGFGDRQHEVYIISVTYSPGRQICEYTDEPGEE